MADDSENDQQEDKLKTSESVPPEIFHPNIEAALTGDDKLYTTGRPSKCTPELLTAIQCHIMNGSTAAKACQMVGIHKDTYYDWVKKIEEFSDACDQARLQREQKWIQDGAYNPEANANFIRFLLQSHPDTRDDFKPPVERSEVKADVNVNKEEKLRQIKESLKQEGFAILPQDSAPTPSTEGYAILENSQENKNNAECKLLSKPSEVPTGLPEGQQQIQDIPQG